MEDIIVCTILALGAILLDWDTLIGKTNGTEPELQQNAKGNNE